MAFADRQVFWLQVTATLNLPRIISQWYILRGSLLTATGTASLDRDALYPRTSLLNPGGYLSTLSNYKIFPIKFIYDTKCKIPSLI